MSYTRKQISRAFLAAIGNPNPTQFAEDFVIAWSQFETTAPPGAAFNPWNTTEPNTPGVVGFFNCLKKDAAGNCVEGVRNYDSFEHGVQANAKVLQNGDYPELLAALKTNNEAALKAPNQAIKQELGLWGTGNALNIAALAGRPTSLLGDQVFPGNGPVVVPPVVPPPVPAKAPDVDTPAVADIEARFAKLEADQAAMVKELAALKGVVEKQVEPKE